MSKYRDESNAAWGAAGNRVRDIAITVTSAAATTSHLTTVGETKALCGQPAALMSPVWFELTGCARCRRTAADRGLDKITDIDGQVISIQNSQ